ncbi:vWA domain-containing protein [Enhygromyxa salina]|uniref:von Willebrand factor type A domain protein n=1 Tax=Enhygromyxa salina TaxID=215803 RepID=A0A2S9XM39_9BACT|nr:vWA domain-containing protein [Enhygromyxa salina]PRP93948.1 von Willebrand factor type A domain protein [Enhygromyxa salina]
MSSSPLGFNPRAALSIALTAAALSSLPRDAEAGGDDVYGTRGAELLVERGHEIELTMDRGYASLQVRRTVHNGIDRHEEAMFWINVPETSVATGLRTLGELHGKPHWFSGDLLEAEAAAARYEELTGIGGYYPKDPALLSWRDQTFLALQVFPVAPHTEKTIEYTLSMPATWADGRWHVWLPALGSDLLAADLQLTPAQQLDQLFVNGEVVARGHTLTLDHDIEIELAPRDPAPVSLELASVETGAQHLAAWRLTLAPQISQVPKHAQVVIALDLSRSLDPSDVQAQRVAAQTYLEHFADPALATQVALLGFDREVHSLSPGFVTAARAIELLDAATLTQRNGSEVGLALAKAAELLSESKRGPRRIVLMTDFETASRVAPEHYAATVHHSDAILHLTDVSDGGPWLERDDQHPWSALAAGSRGVVWSASIPSSWADADEQAVARDVFEEWARPVRIDNLRVRVDGLSLDDDYYWDSFEPTLDEGQGLEDLLLSATPGRELSVEGVTWNIPVHHTAKPSRETGDRWSALVFGSQVLWSLTEPEMMQLAMRGKAVSPVTSYLAIEPGVRPSTEGLEREGAGAFGIGNVGLWGSGSGSGGGFAGGGPSFDKRAWLEGELRDGWTRCGGDGLGAELVLETRSVEILDVVLTTASTSTPLRTCMEQVTWSLALDPHFVATETWRVQLP